MLQKEIAVPGIGNVTLTVDKEGVFTIIGTAEVLEILGKYVKSTPTMADDMALAILKRIIASWE